MRTTAGSDPVGVSVASNSRTALSLLLRRPDQDGELGCKSEFD